jgi:3-hydroxyacyl-CoA dehydrogenase
VSTSSTQPNTALASPVRLEIDGDIGVITIDNPPVNASSAAVRHGLLAAITEVAQSPAMRAAIIIGAGRTFVAGSDIKEFGRPLPPPELPEVLAAIEGCDKPIAAAIHGSALGGGYELALACDWRLADPTAVVGLPEVTLGMIPGAGGTQRLPRLAGIAVAIDVITSGRRVPAPEALALGMIDAVADGSLRDFAVDFMRKHAGDGKRPVSALRVRGASSEAVAGAERVALKAGRGRAVVSLAIEAIKRAETHPVEEALSLERATFQTLRGGEEAAALRYAFFAERAAVKVGGQPSRPVRRVGVVGSGTMGAGIAATLAASGLEVLLIDSNAEALSRGRKAATTTLAQLERFGKLGERSLAACDAAVATSEKLDGLAQSDMIIEAVFEDHAIKAGLLAQIGRLARGDAVIATNTSYLDVEALARASGRTADFVGMHFFAPAARMRLVEVVRCTDSSDEAVAQTLALARSIGKLPILAGPDEGFVGNRIYARYRGQCEYMLEAGNLPQDIDRSMVELGFAMGVFGVSDISGLDIAWRQRQRKAASRSAAERYVTIPDQICELGRLGRKTGAGWYDYDPSGTAAPSPVVAEVIAANTKVNRQLDGSAMRRQVLGAIVNEAALILADGNAQSAADIDLAMINGFGFSRFKGGPLFQAARLPDAEVEAMVDAAAAEAGTTFRRGDVAALLRGVRGA